MKPFEEWRPIPNMPNHEASDMGRIRNRRTGNVLAGHRRSDGYVQICAWREGVRSTMYAHRLIAEAFHGLPNEDKPCIHHKNHDRADNRPANLEWCSYEENNFYAKNGGAWDLYAENNHNAVLSDHEAQAIRDVYESSGLTQSQIAKRFGCTQTVVSDVVTGQTYASVTGGEPVAAPRDLRRRYDYQAMLRFRDEGLTYQEIAGIVGCSRSTASRGCRIALAKRGR